MPMTGARERAGAHVRVADDTIAVTWGVIEMSMTAARERDEHEQRCVAGATMSG